MTAPLARTDAARKQSCYRMDWLVHQFIWLLEFGHGEQYEYCRLVGDTDLIDDEQFASRMEHDAARAFERATEEMNLPGVFPDVRLPLPQHRRELTESEAEEYSDLLRYLLGEALS